jgi:predicted secreted acid phosphatase
MRSLTLVPVAIALLTPFLLGQAPSGTHPEAIFEEPENHAVSVERLLRYHDSGEYEREIREVANSARDFLESRFPGYLQKEAKLAAVFDIDETSLSNWDVMAACGFCSFATQTQLYRDKLFSNAHDPAIMPVLELFNFARDKGFAVFFVTGRPESQRDLTVSNLREAGYSGWADLFMQPDIPEGQPKPPARSFKPRNRQEIENKGYRVVLNIGDQASDLAGCCAVRVFKLPNPFYQLP